MSLKRRFRPLGGFMTAAMTDVFFLLLLTVMVSTLFSRVNTGGTIYGERAVFGTPSPEIVTEVYVDSASHLFLVSDNRDVSRAVPEPVSLEQLEASLRIMRHNDSTRRVVLIADTMAPYGRVARILDIAERNDIRLLMTTN